MRRYLFIDWWILISLFKWYFFIKLLRFQSCLIFHCFIVTYCLFYIFYLLNYILSISKLIRFAFIKCWWWRRYRWISILISHDFWFCHKAPLNFLNLSFFSIFWHHVKSVLHTSYVWECCSHTHSCSFDKTFFWHLSFRLGLIIKSSIHTNFKNICPIITCFIKRRVKLFSTVWTVELSFQFVKVFWTSKIVAFILWLS